jgi:hypothetical protein
MTTAPGTGTHPLAAELVGSTSVMAVAISAEGLTFGKLPASMVDIPKA